MTSVEQKIAALVFIFFGTPFLYAENLGELSIGHLLLKPSFRLEEPSSGAFELKESSFAIDWVKVGGFSGRIRVGSTSLINVPHFANSLPANNLGVFEGYASYEGIYGKVTMGLIPLNYSLSGEKQESEIIFPRSLIFQRRIVGLRDYGISFYSDFSDHFTRLVIHNGEGGEALDQNTWVTMQWGGGNGNTFTWMISAQTGDSDSSSMGDSQSVIASVDRSLLAHWRLGGISVDWQNKGRQVHTILEAHYGELEQETKVTRFASGHIDLFYRFNGWFQVFVRWDELEPDGGTNGDQQREVSVGFSINGDNSNSVFSVIGTQVTEESIDINNDRLLVQWKITPSSSEN